MEIGFILKKLVSTFVMPMSFGLILFLIGLILLFKNQIKYSKVLLTFSLIWMFLFGQVHFSNLLLKPLESQYKTLKIIPNDVKYILLLGGDRYNRGWEALRLYHLIPNSKIITSGYGGSGKTPEAILSAEQLINSGIPKDDIIVHPKPKDTKEEAVKIKKVLKDERFILITSASHMPRAMAIFRNEGLNPIPAPTTYWIENKNKLNDISNGQGLYKSDIAWHEYLGLIWGKIRGQF